MLGDVWLAIKKCYDDTKFQRWEQKKLVEFNFIEIKFSKEFTNLSDC